MILGYLLAVITGLSLGLMGGGGSILTVPILVYILELPVKVSIAMSLAIVGTTAVIGSYSHYKAGNINIKIAFLFAPFAMVGTFLGAKLATLLSDSTQLIFFAIIMLIASIFMFKGRKEITSSDEQKLNFLLIAIQAIFVGVITGIVGVGGGFMIVPALVLLGRIPMKQAIGTSLVIIALNSLTGFLGYISQVEINWTILISFAFFTAIGIIIGTKLVNYVTAEKLKKGFAVFLVLMGIFILYKSKDVFTKTSYVKEYTGQKIS